MSGTKHDQEKLRYDLIPPFALEQLAAVYTHGAKKYEDFNWQKGFNWSRVYAALERHIQQWRKGEDYDLESGCLHLSSVAWCAFTLMEYFVFRRELDDRVKAAPEQWKVYPRDRRYEVSSLGKIRNKKTSVVRKLSLNSVGYPVFNYRKPGSGGKWQVNLVHRWVAETFWRPLEKGEVVHHRDGCKTNNCWWNLEICDQRGNMISCRRDLDWSGHDKAFGAAVGGRKKGEGYSSEVKPRKGTKT